MSKHKQKCETLRKIRIAIAEKLGLKGKIKEEPCNFDGDCKGTCPACQKEENMLKEAMINNKCIKDIKAENSISNNNFVQTMGLVSTPVSKNEKHAKNTNIVDNLDNSIDGIIDRTEYNDNYFGETDDDFVIGESTFDYNDVEGDIAFGEIDDYEDELTGIDEPWDDNEESTENISNNKEE